MRTRTFLFITLAAAVTAWGGAHVSSQSADTKPTAERTSKVVLASEVKWRQLNPARGDKSPRAGILWGDITKDVASGVLLKFADGFSSPPHIHNITYRAVVISGAIHNDDPKAERMWMGPGSFWTQPAGESHITAAKGSNVTAFLEIMEGPYLVQRSDQAFDNGERPVNILESNVVWLDASDVTWIDQPVDSASADAPNIAFLWGSTQDGKLNGTFLKLPAGYSGGLVSKGSSLRAVVIRGPAGIQLSGETEFKRMEPGSYFGSDGASAHQISCGAGEECLLYVRAEGKYNVILARRRR